MFPSSAGGFAAGAQHNPTNNQWPSPAPPMHAQHHQHGMAQSLPTATPTAVTAADLYLFLGQLEADYQHELGAVLDDSLSVEETVKATLHAMHAAEGERIVLLEQQLSDLMQQCQLGPTATCSGAAGSGGTLLCWQDVLIRGAVGEEVLDEARRKGEGDLHYRQYLRQQEQRAAAAGPSANGGFQNAARPSAFNGGRSTIAVAGGGGGIGGMGRGTMHNNASNGAMLSFDERPLPSSYVHAHGGPSSAYPQQQQQQQGVGNGFGSGFQPHNAAFGGGGGGVGLR